MIKIEILDENNLNELNKIDNSFTTMEKVTLTVTESEKLDFILKPLPNPIKKSWKDETEDASCYIDSTDKIVFFAYYDNKFAGQIILHKYWNNFGYIEDLRVSKDFRRQGIGKSLMNEAIQWSINKKLAGLRLETQDINSSACKFYKSMGFSLEGFDRRLYYGIPESKKEVALYWYLLHPTTIH